MDMEKSGAAFSESKNGGPQWLSLSNMLMKRPFLYHMQYVTPILFFATWRRLSIHGTLDNPSRIY
jgi:hypothetical protein